MTVIEGLPGADDAQVVTSPILPEDRTEPGIPPLAPPEPEPVAEEPASVRPDTSYVVLAQYEPLKEAVTTVWSVVAPQINARSTREALEKYTERLSEPPADGTILVAVASRSWKPVPVGVTTETITRIVIGGE